MPESKPNSRPVAHHVEVYHEDSTGDWGAQCLTCGYDQAVSTYAEADRLAGLHHHTSKNAPLDGAS